MTKTKLKLKKSQLDNSSKKTSEKEYLLSKEDNFQKIKKLRKWAVGFMITTTIVGSVIIIPCLWLMPLRKRIEQAGINYKQENLKLNIYTICVSGIFIFGLITAILNLIADAKLRKINIKNNKNKTLKKILLKQKQQNKKM